ncbi:YfjI family protein [Acinetobacter sp. YH12243]|uniref:YfjI family protein n=1 Tax=Acinetobacter sp. YH12243 TaxID=2601169 RepID=UPI0015D0F806|nr:YfjI family protein [Acinetobacter sp. YH12243]
MNAKIPCDKAIDMFGGAAPLAVSTDPVTGNITEFHSIEDFTTGCIDERNLKVKPESYIYSKLPDYNCEECTALPYVNPEQLGQIVGYAIKGIAKKYDTDQTPHKEIDSKEVSFLIGKAGVFASNTNKKYMPYVLGTDDINLFVKLAKAGEVVVHHKDIDAAYQIIKNGIPESIFRMMVGEKPPVNNADLFIQADEDLKNLSPNLIKKFFFDKKQQIEKLIESDLIAQPQVEEMPVDQLINTKELGVDWKEPKPIKSELLPVQQLSQDMLPLEFKEYVFDEAIGADNMSPDMVAACLITSFASLIGAKVGVKPKTYSNWTIVPNLWGGIVAPPSSKKSPAFNAGTYPLDRLVATAREEFKEVKKKHEILSFAKDADKSALKSKIKDASKKGDEEKQKQLIEEMMQLEDEAQPILRRYKTNDSSPEALAELEKQNPNGVLVLRDELTGWLESVDKDPSERAFYLEAFNGDKPYEFDRILRGHGYIENHCLSILGGIQPDKLITYLEPSIKGMGNDGLFQRFQVLVYPDATEWQYVDRIPNKLARNEVFELFKQVDEMDEYSLVKMGANPTDDYNTRPYFRFGQKAQELYIKWTTDLHKNKIENEEHSIIAQHLQKYPKLMTSLALIFHIIDGIKFGSVGDISEQSADMAIQWCEYLESHARRIYGLVLDAATIKASSIGQKLLKLNAEHDWRIKGFKAREVHRKNWKGLTDIESVENALELLVDNNWLVLEEIEPTVKGGRPSKQYWINPKIYEMS